SVEGLGRTYSSLPVRSDAGLLSARAQLTGGAWVSFRFGALFCNVFACELPRCDRVKRTHTLSSYLGSCVTTSAKETAARKEFGLRFIVAIVSFIIAFLMISYGIAQRT